MEEKIELKPVKVKRTIKIGEKIPNEISFYQTGCSGAFNLGSWFFQKLFEKELSKLQNEEYIFSEICRNENEEKSFYYAIEANFLRNGYLIEWI